MFGGAKAFNQPLAFDTAKVENVRVYVCIESHLMRHQNLVLYSNPTVYQMGYMFSGAGAFNQPISFKTSAVTSVRAYICVESNLMRNHILISFSSHILSDGCHVLRCRGLQSTTSF